MLLVLLVYINPLKTGLSFGKNHKDLVGGKVFHFQQELTYRVVEPWAWVPAFTSTIMKSSSGVGGASVV